ncbi:NUDIX domain-containing protein [uncultured Ferrovibrio sp.]|jgi:predicted NUDIX family NTP pyrophosphohydrolase|uniref:NUDIX domain-containing protein n=1 Tax=uncultured Ferrovibrio sp. TaxID=1576913 RepID=UPI00262565A4|nr:NUDIX domain-containing protein [uncultured Ferrovibrio sp.]
MGKESAGLLLYRHHDGKLEVFLAHPGGPFWAKKDLGAWSIPKGEPTAGENLLNAACREFEEETGFSATGPFTALKPCRQTGGKLVHAWATKMDCDPAKIRCNTFRLEWPPRSGRYIDAPEIDRAAWFGMDEARRKINPAQVGFLDELETLLANA